MSNPITLSVQSQSPIVLELGFNFVAQSAVSGGGGSGDPFRRDVLNFVQYPTFPLSAIVTAGSTSSLFINGQKQTYVTDYIVSGSTLTWVGAAIAFTVTSFEFYYQ